MSIFTTLRLSLTKKRFIKQFHPLGMKKKRTFLVSVPQESDAVMETLSFLGGLRTWGRVLVLIPNSVNNLYYFMKENHYERFVYERSGQNAGKSRKSLMENLKKHRFHFLIELNKPADTSLPYVTSIEKRVCFYNKDTYPYYNILIKNGFTSLNEFFTIKKINPAKVLSFVGRTKSKVLSRYGKRKPLCIINGALPKVWQGDTMVIGSEITRSDPELVSVIHSADSYCGAHDILYDFAKLFKKTIIEP